MDKYFSYYRVSSTNQAENGVSLDAQREANLRYAKEKGFEIVKEFREVQSAAKAGRIQFNLMMKETKKRDNIKGIIFHDVDRSTRSISDWAKINELSRSNRKICFSKDGTDLSSRQGILVGNIKAAVAEDFIINLSEETKKGLHKKAEMGYSVFGHPVMGYISKGGGIREIDPDTAPLIRKCFELYATNKYTLKELADEMYKRGLRTRHGKKLEFTKVSRILNDRYYIGITTMKGKIYNGIHKPLISVKLFNQVQSVLQRRYTPHMKKNKYKFPHMLTCGYCGKPMRAVTAKHRYQYYCCRHKDCEMKPIREDKIELWLLEKVQEIKFTGDEAKQMFKTAKELKKSFAIELIEKEKNLKLQVENIDAKLNKLTDMFIEDKINKEIYDQKREQFIMDKKTLESEINGMKFEKEESFSRQEELLNLLANPVQAYQVANYENKANLIQKMMKKINIFPEVIKIEWQTQFLPYSKTKTSD